MGESLGGWVSSWAASEYPDRVASLQLLCMGGTKVNPAVMERLKTSTRAAALEDDTSLTRDRLRLLWAEWDDDFGNELTEVRYEIYHEPGFQRNLHNLRALQEVETRERNLLRPDRMARIKAPTLAVWANQNRSVTSRRPKPSPPPSPAPVLRSSTSAGTGRSTRRPTCTTRSAWHFSPGFPDLVAVTAQVTANLQLAPWP
ncbi:hypothetical protein GCM10009574_084660 [Streptomyces asiaticus]|uniref:AB hydrolase-1 domain-containing protein n=2 Tax=Streptomyces rhizosphaericus TaxID=114699 RepID=A0ABP4BH80_9ACTN